MSFRWYSYGAVVHLVHIRKMSSKMPVHWYYTRVYINSLHQCHIPVHFDLYASFVSLYLRMFKRQRRRAWAALADTERGSGMLYAHADHSEPWQLRYFSQGPEPKCPFEYHPPLATPYPLLHMWPDLRKPVMSRAARNQNMGRFITSCHKIAKSINLQIWTIATKSDLSEHIKPELSSASSRAAGSTRSPLLWALIGIRLPLSLN